MAGSKLSLGPAAAAYLVERYDLEPHPLLRTGRAPIDAGEDAQRELLDAGRADLKRRGLIETDEVHPFLDDAWNLLAHPPLAVGLAVRDHRGTDFNAVLVEHGRSTIQAYQADGDSEDDLRDIVISRHEYGGPSGNAANLLGEIKPGSGGSASVPTEIVETMLQRMSANPNGSMSTAMSSAGIRQADAQVLNKAFTAKRTKEAVITLRTFDSKVRRTHKLPVTLQFLGTEDGSYTTQKKPGGDGREWFTVAPTDSRKFASTIDEMAKALTAPARR